MMKMFSWSLMLRSITLATLLSCAHLENCKVLTGAEKKACKERKTAYYNRVNGRNASSAHNTNAAAIQAGDQAQQHIHHHSPPPPPAPMMGF